MASHISSPCLVRHRQRDFSRVLERIPAMLAGATIAGLSVGRPGRRQTAYGLARPARKSAPRSRIILSMYSNGISPPAAVASRIALVDLLMAPRGRPAPGLLPPRGIADSPSFLSSRAGPLPSIQKRARLLQRQRRVPSHVYNLGAFKGWAESGGAAERPAIPG
jgi:hypothetical protein